MADTPASLIRALRQRLGLPQEEFAQTLGVAGATVNRWENGHHAPNARAWKAIRDLAEKHGLPALARAVGRLSARPGR